MNNDLSSMAQLMIPAVDSELRKALEFNGTDANPFLGMMQYHMGWVDEALQPIKQKSGKRIRPLICMLVTDAAFGEWNQAIPAAASIELLHNFSLVHDDIEDSSPTRRGRMTVWKIWGEAQAINSGDAMFAIAHKTMGRLLERGVTPPIVVQAFQLYDDTCFRLTQGQYADMDFETRDEVSVGEYIEMITSKTAALLSLSAELGALVADAPREIVEHYAAFGLNLGLAFQVVDDILGIWGNESVTGKSVATDIVTRKKTLPVLYGLGISESLRALYRDGAADKSFVTDVVNILEAEGAKEFAAEQAKRYSDAAVHHLQAASPQGKSGDALFQLVDMLLMREM